MLIAKCFLFWGRGRGCKGELEERGWLMVNVIISSRNC
jgi:hypothetical protein